MERVQDPWPKLKSMWIGFFGPFFDHVPQGVMLFQGVVGKSRWKGYERWQILLLTEGSLSQSRHWPLLPLVSSSYVTNKWRWNRNRSRVSTHQGQEFEETTPRHIRLVIIRLHLHQRILNRTNLCCIHLRNYLFTWNKCATSNPGALEFKSKTFVHEV